MANDTKTKGRLSEEGAGVWTDKEHERFLEAMDLYPKGPWKLVAKYVGTRNARQTMTHAQKFRQKIERHQRGLRTKRRDSSHQDKIDAPEKSKTMAPPLLPLGYDSPKDVSNGAWLGSMTAMLNMHPDAILSSDFWGNPANVHSVYSPLPMAECDVRMPAVLDVPPVWFDDCLDYFIESFS